MLDLERAVIDLGVIVRHAATPGVAAGTLKIPSGYLIIINHDLSYESQLDALEHELWHIIFGHFDERKYLSEEEKEAEVEAVWLGVCDCIPKEG